jgi:hypothetical protein
MRSTSQDCSSPVLLADWVPFVQLVPDFKQGRAKACDMMTLTDFSELLPRWDSQRVFISQSVDDQWRREYSAIKDLKSQREWLHRTIEARYTIQKVCI